MGLSLSVPLLDDFKQSLIRQDWRCTVSLLKQNRRLIDVRLSRSTGDKAFHAAVRAGDPEAIVGMIDAIQSSLLDPAKQADTMEGALRKVAKAVNQVNARGQTPLMLAAEQGNVPVALALLNAGADPWLGDDLVERTCLHYAAGTGKDGIITAVSAHVKSHPAMRASQRAPGCLYDVYDIPATSGMTPLHYAAWHRQIAAVVALTREGASIYSRSGAAGMDPDCPRCNEGSTPLHLASLKGSYGTVKALLKAFVLRSAEDGAPQEGQQLQSLHLQQQEATADPRTITDSLGHTPFAIARTAGHYHILAALNPLTPLAQVLAQDNPEERALGVPRLQELAAKAAHEILLKQVNEVAEQIKEAKQHLLPPSSLYARQVSKPRGAQESQQTAQGGRIPNSPFLPSSSSLGHGSAKLPRSGSHRSHDASAHRKTPSGSAHGSQLAEAASLLARGASVRLTSFAGPAQPTSEHRSFHSGKSALANKSSHLGGLDRSVPGRKSQARPDGQVATLRTSLSGAFSLRSAAALTAQLQQECIRHKESSSCMTAEDRIDNSQHLDQLQEMQGWDDQDLEATSHMARTHRLLRGVDANINDQDEGHSPFALVAVLSAAGATPASAILVDGRSGRTGGNASAVLSAAAGAAVTALSHSSSLQRQSGRAQQDRDSAPLARSYPSLTLPRDVSLLAMVDEDHEAPAGAGLGAAAKRPDSGGPLLSLFSLSRQSSQALGRMTVSQDEGPSAANGPALAQLASLARQASQPLRSKCSPPGGLDNDEPGRGKRTDSVPVYDSSPQQADKAPGLKSPFDQASEHDSAAAAKHDAEPAACPSGQQVSQQQDQAHEMLEDDDDEVCGVCLDSGDFVELRQCGHLMCVDCAKELIRLHQYKTALCPLCRGMICGFRQPVPTL